MKPLASFTSLVLALAVLACGETDESSSVTDRSDTSPAGHATDAHESASGFTQEFYESLEERDWSVHPVDAAVADQPRYFSAELISALRIDIDVRSRHPDQIVGLDWDPFTASQDPCIPYNVDHAISSGDTVLVAVKGACTDTASSSPPDVVAVVGRSGSGWVFQDFRYPDSETGLLETLAQLQRLRDADSTGY